MTRVTTEETIAAGGTHFAFTGSWSTVTDAAASGGSYKMTTTNGDTCDITVPAGSTGAAIVCTMRDDGGTPAILVDGVAIAFPWSQNTGCASADSRYYWYQAYSPPIVLDPAVGHTIRVVASGRTTIDAVRVYDSTNGIVVGRMDGFGHSILYGINVSSYPNRVTQTFLAEAGRQLGMTVVTNQGVPGEDLTNGNNMANNPQFYANPYSPEPGYRRAAAGAAAAAANWYYGLYNVPAQSTWSDRRPEIAVVMHGLNDAGYSVIYDVTGGAAVAGVQPFTWAAALNGGTFQIAQGQLITATTAYNTDANTINTRLSAAGIPFTVPAGASPVFTAGAGTLVFTATQAMTQFSYLSIINAGTITGGPLVAGAPTTLGRAASAGVGYALARFKKRYLDLLVDMNLGSPNTKIACCGVSYVNDFNDPTFPSFATTWIPLYLSYARAIAETVGHPTVKNAFYVDVYSALQSVSLPQSAGVANYGIQDTGHPTAAGQIEIGRAIVEQVRNFGRPGSGRLR